MAGGSTSYSSPGLWEYSPTIGSPAVQRLPRAEPAASGGGLPTGYETKASLLLRRILSGMATCSEQSRKVLVVLRRQLGAALEGEKLTLSSAATSDKDSSSDYSAIVSCRNCEGFMVQPVCLPCGHSMCKSCTEKSNVVSSNKLTCPSCSQVCSKAPLQDVLPGSSSGGDALESENCRVPTVIVQNAFRKWYPDWVESCRFREEGNKYANRGDFTSAVRCYSQALQNDVCDYRVLGNRSRAYLVLDDLTSAREDAELACRVRPFWAKGHYRRACVLQNQGRWCEALAAYLLCLNYGGNDQSVIKSACQLIDQNVCGLSEHSKGNGSASLTTPPSTGSSKQPHLADVVGVAVEKMKEYVTFLGSSAGENFKASVSAAKSELVDRSDFECVLCTGLLYNPVTGPCGHSFCQMCICRSFDHTQTCPICRCMLSETFKQHCQNLGKLNIDVVLEGLLLYYFKEAYLAKQSQQKVDLQRKLRAGTSETEYLPVFVCTVAFPTLPCPLHIFEPRYRLMMRRCMESGGKRFGMCPSASEESFASYGTVLCIDNIQSMDDGRFLINSTGERRFKVVGRGMMDGYHMAQIVFLFDERVTEQGEITLLRNLQEEVYASAKKWLDGLPFITKLMLMQSVPTQFPEIYSVPECCPNGPGWVWWLVHACPISPTKKLEFLKCTSLKTRLQMVKELLKSPVFTSSNS